MKQHKGLLSILIIFLVLLCDQLLKIWVKTHMYMHQEFVITDWFRILFIENNGMAFGMEFGSKLFLTIFRIVAVLFLAFWIVKIHNSPKYNVGYITCLSLITAGAAGNIIDCLFYGLIFDNPLPPEVATFFSSEGYASLFHGKVVDMLYFPLVSWTWPDWLPFVGNSSFTFFSPVFNIADAAISVGVIALLIFYSHTLAGDSDKETKSEIED